MKHKITLKRKDTGEVMTIWSVFDAIENRVKVQIHEGDKVVPADIEVIEHEEIWSDEWLRSKTEIFMHRVDEKKIAEEAAEMLKNGGIKNVLDRAEKILNDLSKYAAEKEVN